MMTDEGQDVVTARSIAADVGRSISGAKRMKLRSLLKRFGYVKRSDKNTAAITSLLDKSGVAITPAIVRLGEEWELDYEDWVYLAPVKANSAVVRPMASSSPAPAGFNADGWFSRIQSLDLRSEREVETKFIIPLLVRLEYSEDDRFDGMAVYAAIGSKPTRLVIDFALHNDGVKALKSQPILIVEAKRKEQLAKAGDIEQARNQARSYALWTRCEHYLITDGRILQLHHVQHWAPGGQALFSCERRELGPRFGELHALASRDRLTSHYLSKQRTTEEVSG
jgi:hypothetical protein